MVEQIIITITSCSSIYLFSTKTRFKWGFVAGILGQPFWIHMALANDQWGVLLVSLWYTIAHVWVMINHFRSSI